MGDGEKAIREMHEAGAIASIAKRGRSAKPSRDGECNCCPDEDDHETVRLLNRWLDEHGAPKYSLNVDLDKQEKLTPYGRLSIYFAEQQISAGQGEVRHVQV